MKKVVGMRNIIIVVLCLTIICLGIGFIILSMELSGIKSGKNTYDLSFVEVNNISTVSGGSMSPTGDIKIKEKGRLKNGRKNYLAEWRGVGSNRKRHFNPAQTVKCGMPRGKGARC